MRDVRGVFAEFYALAILVAAVVLVALVVGACRTGHAERAWRAIATGMQWLAVGVVVAGVIATFFFDQAFEIFHELFFPSGSYTSTRGRTGSSSSSRSTSGRRRRSSSAG